MTATQVLVEITKVDPRIRSLGFFVYAPCLGFSERIFGPVALRFLGEVLHHNPAEVSFRLGREELLSGRNPLSKQSEAKSLLTAIAVLSKVRVNRGNWHIPMMDFKCDKTPENLETIKELLLRIGQENGVILDSGGCWQYYSAKLLSETDWLDFLAWCNLFTGFSDTRYVCHAWLDRRVGAALRVTAGGIKLETPKVIDII